MIKQKRNVDLCLLLFFVDLEKEVEKLNKENKQANQTIDQVTKSSEGENKGKASPLQIFELM